VEAISPRTVERILQDVDLQPHRTRYWRTTRLDARFKERAEKVLWCYGNAERLARQGLWTVAVDEVPNFQVLERDPIRRAVPGFIERQEFEYTRHGTVNLLLFLIVHTGRMEVAVEATKDAEHYIQELRAFRRRHRGLKGVFLIQDGDPSHTAGDTETYWSGCQGWWRPRFTPAHASWLNQAELLVGAFGYHYLKRDSWASREAFLEHVLASGPEYNRLYAHPFEWTWTNQQMRQWFAKHAPEFVA
jgi:DDE superfamily endonuclease